MKVAGCMRSLRSKGAGARRLAFALMLVLAAGAAPGPAAVLAHGPEPIARIDLEPLGYEGLQAHQLLTGSPMLTVDFVDEQHVLVTFEVRRLMKREPDALPGEQDRTVAACLVEVATGHVLARTEWRLHDRAQYLWNMGNGRFLLRIRNELSVFAPMQHGAEDAFRASPFLVTDRRLVAVLLSADRDLLTVESVKRPDMSTAEATANNGPEPNSVQVNFYRIRLDDTGKLVAINAGAIRSRTAVALPITTTGYLDILEGGKGTWYFNFDEHAGKVKELLAFDTKCMPKPVFVGHSDFVVFGCKSEDRRIFAGFDLQGEEMWQQGLYDPYVGPTFSFAPAAGRFALGRTLVAEPMAEDASPEPSFVTGEDVRVFQMHSGRQIFRIDCTPVERAGGNYALAPDGLELAVVREAEGRRNGDSSSTMTTSQAVVEIYALPPLSVQDIKDVKAAQAAAPQDTDARIDQALIRLAKSRHPETGKPATEHITPAAPARESTVTSSAPATADQNTSRAKDSPAAAGAAAASANSSSGDAQPEEPRKPPTLYGPDEKPEHK